MPQDTRRYEHKQWDALVGVSDGFTLTNATFLAARTGAGTITLGTVGSNVANAIARIDASFFGAPSGTSTLTIQNGGTTVWQAFLFAGQNAFTFSPPLLGSPGNALLVGVNPGGGTAITSVLAGTIVPYPYTPTNTQ